MFGNNAGGFGGAELGDLGGYGGNDFAGGAAGKTISFSTLILILFDLHFVKTSNIL